MKVEHFSKISRWVLKRGHFNKDLEKNEEKPYEKHRNQVEERQSQKQEYMKSFECYFYSKSIFKPPSEFSIGSYPFGCSEMRCNRRGVTLNCAGGIAQPLLVHEITDCQKLKA